MKMQWILLVAAGAMLVVSGMLLERLRSGGDASRPRDEAWALSLQSENRALAEDLDKALADAAQWRQLAAGLPRAPVSAVGSRGEEGEASAVETRDAVAISAELAEAARRVDGDQWLGLLLELAALGDEHYPEVAAEWSKLVNLSAGDLDALGLSRMDLSAALASEAGLVRFVLDEQGLDPAFRQFAAETVAQAGFALRRAILDTLDFSIEKDTRVLSPLIRAAQDIKDAGYVDRFLRLVQRTDLYNDTRSSIAFMIAEIEGNEAFAALEVLRASGGHARIVPVLASIHSPPATGLLVVNGFPPGADRIGLNDVLLEYNGQAIRNAADLTRADSTTRPGDVVAVRVFRDGGVQLMYVTVTDTAPGHLHFDGRPIVKKG